MNKKGILIALTTMLITTSSSAQETIVDPLNIMKGDIADMYSSADIDYDTRIDRAGQQFIQMMEYVNTSGDEGDSQQITKGYLSFVSLLKKADKLDQLDNWNRKFILHVGNNPSLKTTYLTYMAAAYKESDQLVQKAVNELSYKGQASEGLKFLDDNSSNLNQLPPYEQARLLIARADLDLFTGNIDAALKTSQKALVAVEKAKGENSPTTMLFKMFQETALAYSGKYQEAINLATEIASKLESYKDHDALANKDIRGTDYVEYPSLLSRIAAYYNKVSDHANELKYNEKALETAYDNYGSHLSIIVPDQAESIPSNGALSYLNRDLQDIKLSLADNYQLSGQDGKAIALYSEILNDYREKVNKASGYSSIDIETINAKMEPLIALAPKCAYLFPDNQTINELAYDCSLQYKNFTLFTDHYVLDMIRKDNNPSITAEYDEIVKTKQLLDHASKEEAQVLNDKISQLNEKLLTDLDFSTVGALLDSKWTNVQDALNTDDAAIEFIVYKDNSGTSHYMANLLRNTGKPSVINLCSEKELTSILEPYTSSKYYDLIWKPILGKLDGVKNIYFSPTGIFYKTAIEYLPNESGELMNSHYKMYRLSSTRQLAERSKTEQSGNAVVYGGIKYELEAAEPNNSVESSIKLDDSQKQSLRAGINYLPQTLEEMKNVTNIISPKEKVTQFSAENGTEASFKSLSGQKIDILHVATHGFYVPKHRKSALANLTKNAFNSIEDQSLNRSGLIMAGAVNSLNNQRVGKDDGILTAKEISRLDLGQVRLAVLSACETGLGDITGEGVFGLQRGLKKAGIHSLVMSLWKVDDEATQTLMTNFYQNMVKGISLNEAFTQAQHKLMTMENGKFKDPRFWAAFIMLDALE